MKKVLKYSGLLLALLLITQLWLGVPTGAQAGPKGGGGLGSGDTDGNGKLDITDAVYLLDYLFRGGKPPVACAAEVPDLKEGLAAIEAAVRELGRWPPKPKDIVNLSGKNDVGPTAVTIYDVADAPEEKWLVITDFSITGDTSNKKSPLGLELVEVFQGKEIVKLSSEFTGSYNWLGYDLTMEREENRPGCVNAHCFGGGAGGTVAPVDLRDPLGVGFSTTGGPYRSAIGLAFRPGSRVALRHSGSASYSYAATGYLTSQ